MAIEHDLVVITDEVYEHLVYDAEHVPIATLPGMVERTLTLSSAGKSYSFTGWKVGWATGPAELVGAVLAAKQWLTFTSGAPLQPAVAHALDELPDWPAELARDLRTRRDLLCDGLAAIDGIEVFVPGRHLLRHHRRVRASAGTTAWRSARRCPSAPGWWRSRARSSTTTSAGPAGTWSAGRSARPPS